MGPSDFLLVVMLTALTFYAVLGGADFGAGVWEFTTALQSTSKERRHIYRAIGPVWEANHVWLIFVLMILMNGFPLAFAALGRALWIPLLIALCGIVFRGASYVFRSYGAGDANERTTWEAVFAVASTSAPFFLGACAGAVASGKLALTDTGGFEGSFVTGWLSSLAIFTGFYSIGMCAYLAAVYLAREAQMVRDKELQKLWRQRSLSTGLWMGVLSFAGLAIVWVEAPTLAAGFIRRGWPLVIISILAGIGSLVDVWRHDFRRAVFAAGGAVAAVLWGWGISQYPAIIPPAIISQKVAAPDNVLWMMLAVITTGAVLLLPALWYLFTLFKSAEQNEKS
ncbi:MAG: cytochrome d ubiquinol oxidase subunit II [Pirellulaceae bacterium]